MDKDLGEVFTRCDGDQIHGRDIRAPGGGECSTGNPDIAHLRKEHSECKLRPERYEEELGKPRADGDAWAQYKEDYVDDGSQ